MRLFVVAMAVVVVTGCSADPDVSDTSEATLAGMPASTTTVASTTAIVPSTTTTTVQATTTMTFVPATTMPDTTPPLFEVVYPKNGGTVTEEVIRFHGITEPGAQVLAGRWAADVDTDGNWSLILVVAPGDNDTVLSASDDAGNTTTVRLTVTYDPPAPVCEGLVSAVIPDTATTVSWVVGDLDGNGADDIVTVYFDTADDTPWVHMALDYGYATAVEIEDTYPRPAAISTVKFAGSNDLALVKVSAGATTQIFGVFALIGCDAVYTTYNPHDARTPTWFPVGAGGTHRHGTACPADGIVRTESWYVGDDDWETGPWDITVEEFGYDPDLGHFAFVSSTTTQMSWAENGDALYDTCHFDCPGAQASSHYC